MTVVTEEYHYPLNGRIRHGGSINQFHEPAAIHSTGDRMQDALATARLGDPAKLTVAELMEWLKQWPPDATASGYEGEGGSWVCVHWETTE